MAHSTQTTGSTATGSTASNPVSNPFNLIFHMGKTLGLTGAVLKDQRVHWLPKATFVGGIAALLAAVLFPEMAADVLAAVPTAGIFDALGIPTEAGIDWVVFSVAAFNLLKLFPAEVVGEHYDRLFGKHK